MTDLCNVNKWIIIYDWINAFGKLLRIWAWNVDAHIDNEPERDNKYVYFLARVTYIWITEMLSFWTV